MYISPSFLGKPLDTLDTPALVVDLDRFERNIARIVSACQDADVAWRPHCKTHKSGDIARLLVERGAIGVTCAKLSEAVVMADAGVHDILIANQITAPNKIARLMALRQRVDVAVCVDDIANVLALDAAAQQAGVQLRVLIEVDTGTKRAGVLPGQPVLDLARQICASNAIALAGVMTWEGHTTQIVPESAKSAAIDEAITALTRSAALCREAGIPIDIVSCGGTGTYSSASRLPGVTEIQAGGGIFGDVRYKTQYHVDVDYALFLLSTVTSRPTPQRIVIDAGKKALSCDAAMPLPQGLPPIASIGFSAEHGKIELRDPSMDFALGTQVALVPGYADTTVHLHRRLYGYRDGLVETEWSIRDDARLL